LPVFQGAKKQIDNYIGYRYTNITVADISESVNKGGVLMPESSERGALTEAVFYILLSVYSPLHGCAIMQNIDRLSGGRVVLGAGTLYGAINTLLEKGWITSVNDSGSTRKKDYVITDNGKKVVRGEMARLEELLANGKKIGGTDHENNY